MSSIIKSTSGTLDFKNQFGQTVKQIPITRITIYPKNKYSKVFQEISKKKEENADTPR